MFLSPSIAWLVAAPYIPGLEYLSVADVLGFIHEVDSTFFQHRLPGISATHAVGSKGRSRHVNSTPHRINTPTHSWLERGPMILEALFFLALSARKYPTGSKIPFAQLKTSAIFVTSLANHSGFHAMRSQHFLWKRWPFEWSWKLKA
ncbi:hypothetical protein EDB87DRAFT_1010249 [Lactarius vividus]|nr:hypothetical protein EDB87DRAFT_1010249 [Lactarius vividus]